jgi:RNA polymerase sigma-70 factor, ECF subfamily
MNIAASTLTAAHATMPPPGLLPTGLGRNVQAPADDAAQACAVPVSWTDLVSHRGYLVRFAQRKLRDTMMAEDAVHDVFEAVLSGRAIFRGRAALRSWLTAVLKNKIVDAVRRDAGTDPLDDESEDGGAFAIECPQPRPDQVAEQRQLLARALTRIEALPASLRDAMRLRVLEEQSTESVCATLGITEDNLFVRMHRARKQLLS